MQRPTNKILSLLLVAAMIFTMMPLTAAAQDDICNHIHDENCSYVEGADCNSDHEEHDADCGYIEAVPCDHQHDADCGGLTLGDSGKTIVAAFDGLDPYTEAQGYEAGTVTLADLKLPDTLTGTDADGEAVAIDGVSWQSAPDFDPDVEIAFPGYKFTAVLPEGYELAEGVTAPVISVFIRPEGGMGIQALADGRVIITSQDGWDTFRNTTIAGWSGNGNVVELSSSISGSLTGNLVVPNAVTGLTINGNGNTITGEIWYYHYTSPPSTNNTLTLNNLNTASASFIGFSGGGAHTLKVEGTCEIKSSFQDVINAFGGSLTIDIAGGARLNVAAQANSKTGIFTSSSTPLTINVGTGSTLNVTSADKYGIDSGGLLTISVDSGGSLYAQGGPGQSGIEADKGLNINCSGSLTAIGGANTNTSSSGGNGIYVYGADSSITIADTGNLTANGGNGTTGGYGIFLNSAHTLTIECNGSLTAIGGNGTTGNGGNGIHSQVGGGTLVFTGTPTALNIAGGTGGTAYAIRLENSGTFTNSTTAGDAHNALVVDTTSIIYPTAGPLPSIFSISPNSGLTTGGTTVTLNGTNLTGTTAVMVGGASATSITNVSATQITFVTPAGTAGAANVVVTTPGGTATLTNGFTYTATSNAPPTATNVSAGSTAPVVGTQITGTYTYNAGTGTGAGTEGTSTFKWYRSTANTWGGASPEFITGATAKTYTPTGADVGKYLYFEVIPSSSTLAGTAAQSGASGQAGIMVSLTVVQAGTTGTATINSGTTAVKVTSTASPTVAATLGNAQSVAWTVSSGGGTFTNAATISPGYSLPAMTDSVTGPITITATFTPVPKYTVTVNSGTGGGSYAQGATVTITANTPAGGNQFKDWTVVSGGVTLASASSATTTFTMPASAVTVTANYEALPAGTYSITVQNDGNGTANANVNSATSGTPITLTATPDSGYRFKEWQVISGGVTITGNSFTMPAANVVVKAIFELIPSQTYTLTVNAGTGGTVTGGGSFAANTAVTVTATPNAGYAFNYWASNDMPTAGGGNVTTPTYQFLMPGNDVTLTANFKYVGGGGGSSDSDSSSGSGSGYTPPTTTTSNAPTDVSSTQATSVATAAGAAAKASGQSTATVNMKNVGNIPLAALQAMAKAAGMPVKFQADSMNGKSVDVRITLDLAKSTKGLNLSASTTSARAKETKSTFEKYFSNNVSTVSLGQQGSFGQPVEIAAKVDLTGMDTTKLEFYAYDKATNSYKKIEKPAYWIDKNGYLHFTTELAGDIIISSGPLEKK